jgi:uncharacterized protein (DUF2147 family)
MEGIARYFTGAVALLAATFPTGATAGENLDGFWMDSDGEVILEIGACGDARCGKVAWLKKPLGSDGLPLRDFRNSDPTLRARRVCGLEVVSGFTKLADGGWGDGTVYVSDEGTSYSGYAQILSPTQVKVTGYIGLMIFGASEVWTKVSIPFERCSSAEPTPKLPPWTTKTINAPTKRPTSKSGTANAAPAR